MMVDPTVYTKLTSMLGVALFGASAFFALVLLAAFIVGRRSDQGDDRDE